MLIELGKRLSYKISVCIASPIVSVDLLIAAIKGVELMKSANMQYVAMSPVNKGRASSCPGPTPHLINLYLPCTGGIEL